MGRSGGYEPDINISNDLSDENNFSEEEEAMFVADNDTESESDRQTEKRGQDLELSNVTAFRRDHRQEANAQPSQSVS